MASILNMLNELDLGNSYQINSDKFKEPSREIFKNKYDDIVKYRKKLHIKLSQVGI